jgi:AcrR family transcriptional regulator
VQREETRARVFDAAVGEFRRVGVGPAEIEPIVAAAGVSRGTFYFHFPSKDHVLLELERREEARIVDELSPMLEGSTAIEAVLREVTDRVLAAQRRLGADLFREMLGIHFRPSPPDGDDLAEHPLASFLIAAHGRAVAGSDAAEAITATTLFLTGLFGLLAAGVQDATIIDRFVALAAMGGRR